MEKLYFKEIQKPKQIWLWIILLACDLLILYLILDFAFLKTGETDVAGLITMVFTFIVMILLSLGLFYARLITEIRKDGVYFKFSPFHRKYKIIRSGDIKYYDVRKYNPIKDYGGWGIRQGKKKKGKAYNISGNLGIFFEYTDGRKFLLGTQKPEEIRKALGRLKAEGRDTTS